MNSFSKGSKIRCIKKFNTMKKEIRSKEVELNLESLERSLRNSDQNSLVSRDLLSISKTS